MMAEPNEYILVTQKNFLSDNNKERMIEKSFLEIQGTFLVKIRDNTFNGIIGENVFKHIDNFLKVVGPLKIKGLKMETDEDDDPDDIAEIFKIEGNLFDFETPLNYGANNVGNTQDNKKEHHDPSICNVRIFKMIKYSFNADEEYVAIKEHEYLDHLRTNIDACQAYRELFRIMDEEWLVTKAKYE
ncbi:hypothetical protein Tco_0798597 [Tanacetum coccineum]